VPLETSPERPVPVRTVSKAIADWVGRLGRVWIEGQLTEISRRPGMSTVFLTLRDPVADVSLSVAASRTVCEAVGPTLVEGARVVVWASPEVYLTRGTLRLTAYDIRPVGVGELLARLERLKTVLAAEGLFAAERKRPLPFLPGTIGLVTGRGSAAQRDVLENARRRWPAVQFELLEVAVQGPQAVQQVREALEHLDRAPHIDVIVIARGGGSLEDLLPFSDESLVRAVAAARTPVISAIGHEQDAPLLDLVADYRASTPTDAGKRVVPDISEQRQLIDALRRRGFRALTHRLDRETATLQALRSRPVLAAPLTDLDRRAAELADWRGRARRCLSARLDGASSDLGHALARVRALSPAATLERGYAVVQRRDGHVVRAGADVTTGEDLHVRVADGRFMVVVAPATASGQPIAGGAL
jgi:exodeoxyribonuclease VII large subunit